MSPYYLSKAYITNKLTSRYQILNNHTICKYVLLEMEFSSQASPETNQQ